MSTVFFVLISLFSLVLSQDVRLCDSDWDESQCYRTVNTCGIDNNPCRIVCLGEGSCDGSTFNCTLDRDCIIECIGYMSCRGTVIKSQINCPPNNNCTITCNHNSCNMIEINCPSNSNCIINANDISSLNSATINCPINGDCIINANGEQSLKSSTINCPTNGLCTINCNGYLSCWQSVIDSRYNVKSLHIHCSDNNEGCTNIRIFCPESNNASLPICIMSGSDNAKQEQLQIFARNSWYDIDLTEYNGNIINTGNIKPYMYCNEDFSSFCVIADNMWNCDKYYNNSLCLVDDVTVSPTQPTNTPTTTPIIMTTAFPTNDKSEPIETKPDWVLILGIIIAFIVIVIGTLILWYWCSKKAREEQLADIQKRNAMKAKNQYQPLTNIDDDGNNGDNGNNATDNIQMQQAIVIKPTTNDPMDNKDENKNDTNVKEQIDNIDGIKDNNMNIDDNGGNGDNEHNGKNDTDNIEMHQASNKNMIPSIVIETKQNDTNMKQVKQQTDNIDDVKDNKDNTNINDKMLTVNDNNKSDKGLIILDNKKDIIETENVNDINNQNEQTKNNDNDNNENDQDKPVNVQDIDAVQ